MNDNDKTFDQRMVGDSNCGFFLFEPQLDHYSALPLDHRPGFTPKRRAGQCNRFEWWFFFLNISHDHDLR
jgi:hypothetical protein